MHITKNPFLKILFKPLISTAKWLGKKHPKTLVRIRYLLRFRKRLDLNNPKTLNEKNSIPFTVYRYFRMD